MKFNKLCAMTWVLCGLTTCTAAASSVDKEETACANKARVPAEKRILACKKLVDNPSLSNLNKAEAQYNQGVAESDLMRWESAIANFTAALKLRPDYRSALVNREIAYSHVGRQTLAITDYTRATGLDANDAKAYSNRANVLASLKRYDAALKDYGRALTLGSVPT
jgi:tetratricopeptide (TPR) repeat protein